MRSNSSRSSSSFSRRRVFLNFIDTADVYNDGRSEEVVGRAIRAHRDHWVLATKFVNHRERGPNLGGQSRKWVIQGVEESLKRLGTDHIDILYFHKAVFDQLAEPLRAIADLIRAGKLRYFGVSNFRGWRIAEIARLADELGIDWPVASQPLYNIVTRTAEVEQLPAAAAYGIGVISYSPLTRGVLTGKYAPGAEPAADSRAGRGDRRIAETEWRPESVKVAQQVIFALVMPLFVMNVYDRIVPNNATDTLWMLALGVLLVIGMDFMLRLLRGRFIDLASARIDVKLSALIMERVLGMRLEARPASVGSFAANLRSFESVRDFIASATVSALIDLPFALIFLLVIVWIAWPVVLIPLLGLIVGVIYAFLVQHRMHELAETTYRATAQRNAALIESLTALETIKLGGASCF